MEVRKVAESGIAPLIYNGSRYFPFEWLKGRQFRNKHLVNLLGTAQQNREMGASSVLLDTCAMSDMIRNLLRERGESRLLVIGSNNMIAAAMAKEGDFPEAVPHFNDWAACGVKVGAFPCLVDENDFRPEEATRLLAMLRSENAPRVVLGLRDIEAWRMQQLLLREAPDILQRIILLGNGNTPHSRCATPQIASIDWNIPAIVEALCAAISQRASGGGHQTRLIQPRFIRLPQ